MSWQAYIDSTLIGSEKVQSASIFGHDGSTWASTADLSSYNAKELIDSFQDPSTIRSEGLTINGIRYVIIKSDERSIYGKSKENGGFVAVKTKQAVLLGLHSKDINAGDTAKVVEGLSDYLIDMGY